MRRSLSLSATLLAAASLAAPAQADLVTPDSIAHPSLAAVSSADGNPIPSTANLVSNQYVGQGLQFSSPYPWLHGWTTAVASVNGVNVWVPAVYLSAGNSSPVVALAGSVFVQLVQPGTTTPATTHSITVEVLGGGGGLLTALDAQGHVVADASITTAVGPHGGELLTASGMGITSFEVAAAAWSPQPGASSANPSSPSAWGVAEIGYESHNTPEPGGLLLACLGALVCARWRRLEQQRWQGKRRGFGSLLSRDAKSRERSLR